MSHRFFPRACAHACAPALFAALAAALAGCASMGELPTQQLELHAILDHREVAGVGCVLANSAGRWFVVAPGRITVQRSRDPLTVDCARDGASAVEVAPARATGLIDGDKLIGKLVVKAGLDGYVSRFDGAGVAYPNVLTVLLRPARPQSREQAAQADADQGNVMF
ncbi:hypothetical protein [Massilia sp. 9096]|uniref:hypothetical protein n=1 Tax=Massilia sp. 9096 TaxID=1500894 RepID=UPI00068FC396|nr:hypothetical protein [Massilia sp. 9096]